MDEMVDNGAAALLGETGNRLMEGSELAFDEAIRLAGLPEEHLGELLRLAERVRRRFASEKADLCSIVNARSGKCPEDCSFCAQSSHFKSEAPVYPMKSSSEILEAARKAESQGAHRFCIVTSGDALGDRDFETVLEALVLIRADTGLKRCASTGWLDGGRASALKQAGLNRYHHNVETARRFFPSICSTHSYEDKLETISHLKAAGIESCIGGILNLGETARQRVELAFEIRELEPDSVPVNFLIPRAGTPMAGRRPITAMEAARYLALFRLVMPSVSIRLAGGRVETFGDRAALPFDAGVNALLIGDLLTTSGPDARSDISLLRCLGFDVNGTD